MDPTRFRIAIAFSLVLGTLFAGSAIVERIQTRQGEVEIATVIAKARTLDEPTCWVPRWDWEFAHDYTWRSQNSPAGMPAEFVDRGSCETWRVGESTDIIRQVKNDELVVTTFAYAEYRELASTIGIAYAILFGLVYVVMWAMSLGQGFIIRPLRKLFYEIQLRL